MAAVRVGHAPNLTQRSSDSGKRLLRPERALLAALVTSAPAGATQLEDLVREYKRKSAGKVVLQSKGPIREKVRKPAVARALCSSAAITHADGSSQRARAVLGARTASWCQDVACRTEGLAAGVFSPAAEP
jgi:hypothetical protein